MRTGDWKTRPTRGDGPVTGRPSRAIMPVDGATSPASILSSVVFPHPDGPTSVTNSLAPTSSVTSASAVTSPPFRVGYVLLAEWTRNIGRALAAMKPYSCQTLAEVSTERPSDVAPRRAQAPHFGLGNVAVAFAYSF